MHSVCSAMWRKKVSECQPTTSDIQSAPQEEHQLRLGAHLLAERERLNFYVMSCSFFVQIITQK